MYTHTHTDTHTNSCQEFTAAHKSQHAPLPTSCQSLWKLVCRDRQKHAVYRCSLRDSLDRLQPGDTLLSVFTKCCAVDKYLHYYWKICLDSSFSSVESLVNDITTYVICSHLAGAASHQSHSHSWGKEKNNTRYCPTRSHI